MIRRLSLLLLAALVLSGVAWAADPCRFVVMADNWGRPGVTDLVTPPPAYARAIAEANLLQPEFVVFVGDMVRGYCDAGALEQSWEAFDALTKQCERPVHLVVGNHDVFSKESEQIYQRRYGQLWYSFEVKDCHFVVLDSEDQTAPGKIAGPQLAWLESDLAAAKGKRSFVFVHNPVWGADFAKSEWGKSTHPLLAAAGVDTVFAGHVHQYEREPTRDGVRYLIGCGLAAETEESPLAGGFFHYLFVTATGEGPARVAVMRTGAVEPEDIVTSEQIAQVEQFERQFRVAPVVAEVKAVTQTTSWTVSNPFATEVSGTVRFAEAVGWTARPVCGMFRLAPGETTTLAYALTVDPALAEGPIPYRVEYELAGRGVGRVADEVRLIRTVVAPLRRDVTLDGSLAEWSGEPQLRLLHKSQLWDKSGVWEGAESFSAEGWVARDRSQIYVAVKVTDKSVAPTPAGASSPVGDAVTLYLDGRPKALLGRRDYAGGAGFTTITPGDPARIFPPREKSRALGGVRAASQVMADGYTVEIAVPLAEFPYHGDVMGLDLAVKDTSNLKGEVYLFWQGNETNWREASLFGRVR